MATYNESASDTMALVEAPPVFTFPKSASDTIAMSELSEIILNVIASASDSMALSDSPSSQLTMAVAISDTIAASDAGVVFAIIEESAFDSIGMSENSLASLTMSIDVVENLLIGGLFVISGNVYEAVSVNSKTGAHSRYDGYNFNSFAKFDGKYWGCGSDGLYILDGSDDDGIMINASLTTGPVEPVNGLLSRVENAYVVMKNDGPMEVRVTGDDGIMRSYRISKESERYETGRAKLGKGAKNAVWQFELANVDGADFDAMSMKIMPLALSRRI